MFFEIDFLNLETHIMPVVKKMLRSYWTLYGNFQHKFFKVVYKL